MATDLKEIADRQGQVATKQTKDFPALLKSFLPEIQRALPKHMDGDRMARIALTAFRQTPKLAECDPRSVFAAVIQSSQLGLEVGLLGEAHLVPFNKNKKVNGQWTKTVECQLIPGYQGLMKLARNTGNVKDIYAHAVRVNDAFDIVLGLDQTLTHEPLKENGFPASDEARGDIVGFYAVAVFRDGSRTFQAMSAAQVNQIRDGSSGYKASKQFRTETPWDTNYEAMGIKTVIRRLCKYLPKSPELQAALEMDTAADTGKAQNLNVNDAIEGTWAPSDDDEPEQKVEQKAEQKQGPVTEKTVSPNDRPVNLDDAIQAVKEGNMDGARDIARSLSEEDQQQVYAAIGKSSKQTQMSME